MSFWDIFDATAQRFGDRVAVEVQRRDTIERWTYRQLRELALARAASLDEHGVRSGDRCAILADNDASWCVAFLAILRIGAVAVPLDTNYSAASVRTIVRDCGARVLFVNARLRSLAHDAVPDVVLVDLATPAAPAHRTAPHAFSAPHASSAPVAGVAPESAAVILYTSGTTADPKGVVLTHGNLIAERDAALAVLPVIERDRVLGVLPLSHAFAQVANLLLPFAIGARVVFLETVNSTEVLRALAEREITVFPCSPRLLYLIHERLLKEVAFPALLAASFRVRRIGINIGPILFGSVQRLIGPTMRFFLTGGSRFDPAVGRDFYALGFTILQTYGLTETSGAATLTRPDDAHRDTVGRVLPGQEIKILPATDSDIDGEVAIRGPIVMQGYFNRPDATATTMSDRWLLTGDLGKLDADGRVIITGRSKDVIVLATGTNVYPEEIEAQYRNSAIVKEMCVLGLTETGTQNAERLYAVVVPDFDLLREKRIVNVGELLRFEMEGQSIHLPPHKRVLGYEIWFEPLPRTTTGGLKRHEIAGRVQASQQQRTDAAIAATEELPADLHVSVAMDVIRAHSRGGPVRLDANLELNLGLDSLERVELLTELEQRLGIRVPQENAHEIFTVQQLIEATRAGNATARAAAVEAPWAVLLRNPQTASAAATTLFDARPFAAPFLFFVGKVLRLFIGPRVAYGRDHLPSDGPYILAPNHQSYLDPAIICSVLPYRIFKDLFFVGAADYFETPFTKWLARKVKLLPVDPDANLVSAMQASAFGLQQGRILMLFPEGERSIDGTVKRFKKGAPILAQHLGVPIVPVAIRGAYELWPRNRAINWRKLLPFGHRVRVVFGEPIRFESAAAYSASANQLRERVQKLWDSL